MCNFIYFDVSHHSSDLVQCRNGSGEITVVKGEQSPIVGLCIDHRGQLPGFSLLSIDVN